VSRTSRIAKLGLALAGAVLGLAGAEAALRLLRPAGVLGFVALDAPRDPVATRFVLDDELGFRPELGVGEYDERGLVATHVPAAGAVDAGRARDRARVLVLGDSVTRRGRIIRRLEELQGECFVFLNAGVEAYGAAQAAGYYARYGAPLRADHVVLTLHPNDFRRVPALLRDKSGVYLFDGGTTPRRLRPALFSASYLYRLVHAVRARRGGALALEADVEAAVIRLRAAVAERGARLLVLALPTFEPPERWTPEDRAVHRRMIELLATLGVPHVDLEEPVRRAAARGLELQETPGDPWHPSDDAAAEIARYLVEREWLATSSCGERSGPAS
jgi:hypothetical protein